MKTKIKRLLSFVMSFAMLFSMFSSGLFKSRVLAKENNLTVNEAITNISKSLEKKEKINLWEKLALKEAGFNKNYNVDESMTPDKIEKCFVLIKLGEDVTNNYRENLIKDVKNKFDKDIKGKKYSVDTVKAAIVLDEYNKKNKDNPINYDSRGFINSLLARQDKNGSYFFGPLNTSYAIKYLYNHKDVEKVQDSIKKACNFINGKENEEGKFANFRFNAEQHAKIVTSLTEANIDLTRDQWNKKGITPIESLFEFWDGEQFVDGDNNKKEGFIGQTLYALTVIKSYGYGDYVLNNIKFNNIDNVVQPKPEIPQKPIEKEKPKKEKQGAKIDEIINGVISYYNEEHFIKHQASLEPYEYSTLYKAGMDFKNKDWALNEKYQTKYDMTLKMLGSKVNQSLILLDLDKNPNNYENRKLIEEIAKEVDENNSYFRQVDIQAVRAIDTYNKKFVSSKVNYNVEHSIECILKAQCENGGFKQMPRGDSVPLNTAYAISVLSNHRDIKGVNEAINKAIDYLHSKQNNDGGIYTKAFITGYHAEIVKGLFEAGEDVTGKKWTNSNGKNVVDALFLLWNDKNSFDNKKDESVNNRGWREATWKALSTLVSLKNANGGNYVIDGVKVKNLSKPQEVNDEKTCKVNVAILLPEGGKYVAYFKPQEVTISDKKQTAGFTALGALQACTSLYEMLGDLVTSIYGRENQGLNGWMYSVNGVVPSVYSNKFNIKPGDKIIWYYSINGMQGQKPTWDEIVKDNFSDKQDSKDDEKDAFSIEPTKVEVCKGESFKLNVKCNKGNYLVYDSNILGIESGFKFIDGNIKFNVSKDAKPGVYKLTNVYIADVDEESIKFYPANIKNGLIAKYAKEPKNKVASLKDITIVVKEKGNTDIGSAQDECDFKVENLNKEKQFKLGSQPKIFIRAINNTKEEKEAELIVALYNKQGKILNLGSSYQKIAPNNTVGLRVLLSVPDKGDYVIKTFVWDSLDGMKPISNAIEIPVV